jgi:hypothetical protein
MGNHVSVPGGSTYPATPEYGTAFTHFHTIYLKPVLRGLSFEQASAHVENDSTILPAHQQQAEIYAEQLWGTIEHRRFATTSRKAFALVHPNAKQGDLVCIFLGAEVPFVIRRKDSGSGSGNEEFELVGQCYVHGLMEGQGLQLGGVKHITLV